jgi:hypothetical protein
MVLESPVVPFPMRIGRKLARDGFRRTWAEARMLAHARMGRLLGFSNIDDTRLTLSEHFMKHFDRTVAYGPMRGYRIPAQSPWSQNDRAAMLFGVYEREVLALLVECADRYDHLIDVGAADGYYAVGALASNLFRAVVCYEASERGRATIRKSAAENEVLDRLEVRGRAEEAFCDELPQELVARSVLLVDIEGGEFEILTPAVFRKFRCSVVIIEIHDWLREDPIASLAALRQAASETHGIEVVHMGGRDLSSFPELLGYPDNLRWIVCSEGRARLMEWWVCRPLASTAHDGSSKPHG